MLHCCVNGLTELQRKPLQYIFKFTDLKMTIAKIMDKTAATIYQQVVFISLSINFSTVQVWFHTCVILSRILRYSIHKSESGSPHFKRRPSLNGNKYFIKL